MKAQKGGRGQQRSEFTIRPFELKWSEWREKHDLCTQSVHEMHRTYDSVRDAKMLIKIVSDWQRETDAWVLSLSENRRKDFCDLARAESHLLWQDIDQLLTSKNQLLMEDADWRLDWRQRWFVLACAVATLRRLGVDDIRIDDVEGDGCEDWVVAVVKMGGERVSTCAFPPFQMLDKF